MMSELVCVSVFGCNFQVKVYIKIAKSEVRFIHRKKHFIEILIKDNCSGIKLTPLRKIKEDYSKNSNLAPLDSSGSFSGMGSRVL